MLEIKNVTKIYKTKGGTDTKALDDISISFGETGLVFLLGKSGSGKSTLLNVSGGLDEPTSGEVIVKGKSSKNFSGSDFDSYRNTFVGFIFQEYNILEEFNVEDNIALALELQGKPKDRKKINGILREVDLEQYAKRKPNTLSGGQKQRIAIARALIKDPQIIMADEPTGALDSGTGKQVFDTLKKLSQTRLVIVVSHDREFAESYGDRIVELKDGKIISDISKSKVAPTAIDENISVVGNNTLAIKSGAKLTKENFKTIQDFISSTDGDVVVTNGKAEISSFKKANRISEDGETDTFYDTERDNIKIKEYSAEESRFIRSRLPASKAIKIGASGLKLKPVRLIFTIFLSFIAFTMFGLFSTLMVYDGDKVARQSFAESDYRYLNLEKSYFVHVIYSDYDYATETSLKFSDKDLETFQQQFGQYTFGYYSVQNTYFSNVNVNSGKSDYYNNSVNKIAYLPAGHKVLDTLIGCYPTSTEEICISSYLLEVLKQSTVKEVVVDKDGNAKIGSENVVINGANDILNRYLSISVNGTPVALKVVGVFDSGTVDAKYDSLKDSGGDINSGMLRYQYEMYLSETMHGMALVSENFYNHYAQSSLFGYDYEYVDDTLYFNRYDNYISYKYYSVTLNHQTGRFEEDIFPNENYVDCKFNYFAQDGALATHFVGENVNKNSLVGNEIVVGADVFFSVYEKEIKQYIYDNMTDSVLAEQGIAKPVLVSKSQYQQQLSEYDADYQGLTEEQKQEYLDVNYQQLMLNYEFELQIYQSLVEEAVCNTYEKLWEKVNVYCRGYGYENGETVVYNKDQRLTALEDLKTVFQQFSSKNTVLTIDGINDVNCTVVGFHEVDLSLSYNNSDVSSGIYATSDFLSNLKESYYEKPVYETNYVKEEGLRYNGLYVEYDGTESAIAKLLGMVGQDNRTANDVVFNLNVSLYNSIKTANRIAKVLSNIFLYVGLTFAVFSALLLFNFISVSISNKRKEIGILRAVGARGLDVFKIFFSESGIIVGICTLLSVIGAYLGCSIINGVMKSSLGFGVTLFVFGIVSVVMMLVLATVVAFVATFLPVYFAARKKPVESIRSI